MAEKKKKRKLRWSRLAMALYALLVGFWSVNGEPADSFAGETPSIRRKVPPPTSYGYPPTEILATDIPLFFRGSCCRFESRAQLAVKNSNLFWADSSDTPIKRMLTAGGEILPLVGRTNSPVNAVIHGDYIYWIEHGDGPGAGEPAPRLNRTSLDGMVTSVLDEGPRYSNEPGAADIVVTDTDVYWVNTVETPICNEFTCTWGNHSWSIRKVPLNGRPSEAIFTTSVHIVIASLATDGISLYWQEDGESVGTSSIKKMPLGAGAATVIVDGSLNGMVADWQPVRGIAIGGTELFFASYGQGLMKVGVSGGAVTSLSAPFLYYEIAPRKLAVDDANVYWIDGTTLKFVSRSGGNVSTLASGLGVPVDLVISDGRAIWAEAYCCGGGILTGSVKMVSTLGGAVTTLVSGLDGVRSLDVDSSSVLFIEGDYYYQGSASGTIAKVSVGGGPATTIVSAVMAEFDTPIAVDDKNVYFADGSGIKKAPIDGGVVETLASNELLIGREVAAMVTDGQFIYWLTAGRGPTVRKISVDGGPVEIIVTDVVGPARPRYSSTSLVLESGYLYWIEHSHSNPMVDAIVRVPITGGPAVTIASGLGALDDLAVDGADLYFIELGYPTWLRKISVNGGPISNLTGVHDGNVLAADGGNAYWGNFFEVGMVPGEGGPVRYVSSIAWVGALALDADGLYGLSYYFGTIFKVDRSTMDHFLEVVSPRLGESWDVRSRHLIQWWFAGVGTRVTISLSRDGGNSWTTLFRDKKNYGHQEWRVKGPATNRARIRVCSQDSPSVCDTGDLFTIR